MNLCSDNHDEICFEGWGTKCPACEALKDQKDDMETIILDKDEEIMLLNEKLENLSEPST